MSEEGQIKARQAIRRAAGLVLAVLAIAGIFFAATETAANSRRLDSAIDVLTAVQADRDALARTVEEQNGKIEQQNALIAAQNERIASLTEALRDAGLDPSKVAPRHKRKAGKSGDGQSEEPAPAGSAQRQSDGGQSPAKGSRAPSASATAPGGSSAAPPGSGGDGTGGSEPPPDGGDDGRTLLAPVCDLTDPLALC